MHQTASSIWEKYTLRHTSLIHVYFTHTVFTRLSQLISDSIIPTFSVVSKHRKRWEEAKIYFFFASASFFLGIHLHFFYTCKSNHDVCTFNLKLQSSLKIEWKNISNGNCTFLIGGGGVFMIESILSNWTNLLNQIGIQYRL